MAVETIVTREVLKEAGFTSRQIFVISLFLAAIWGVGGYLLGKVEVLHSVQQKVIKQSARKVDLQLYNKKRIAVDKAILETAFEVSDDIDQQAVVIRRKVLNDERLPAGTSAEPLRQLSEKIK